ncbi:nuclear transport factor 2 family protein [Maricaulis sp. CAU 1757]
MNSRLPAGPQPTYPALMTHTKTLGASIALMIALATPATAYTSDAAAPASGPENSDSCSAVQALSIEERAVCIRFRDMVDAVERLDNAAALEHFWSAGFSANIAGQIIKDPDEWATFYANSLGSIADIERLDFPQVEIRTLDRDTILLLNTYDEVVHLHSGERLELTGYGTQIWLRRGDEWRIAHVAGQ